MSRPIDFLEESKDTGIGLRSRLRGEGFLGALLADGRGVEFGVWAGS